MLTHNKINYYLKRFGVQITEAETFVLYDEEYGYKQAVWIVPLTGKQLEKWWTRNQSISKIISIGKRYPIYNENYNKSDGFWDFSKAEAYHKLKELPVYRCHVFTDDDSFLKVWGQRYIYHAGFNQACIEAEKRIVQLRIEFEGNE